MEGLREKVLTFVRQYGPVLPVQISKVLNKDIFFAGAVLSELVASKLIKISIAKIGGSPVYYAPGQEEKLSVLFNHLPLKEKEAYSLLKESKFLRDKTLEPAYRVAMRSLKDFAKEFTADVGQGSELFWRWYLIPETEFSTIIRPAIKIQPKIQPQEQKLQAQLKFQPQIRAEPQIQPKIKKDIKDEFYNLVSDFLKFSNIQIISQESIRKNKEICMIVKIPSSIGNLDFYLVAKNKRSISNADLSLVCNKGAQKKLPTLFLSTGDLSKKGNEYIEKNLKGILIFRKI